MRTFGGPCVAMTAGNVYKLLGRPQLYLQLFWSHLWFAYYISATRLESFLFRPQALQSSANEILLAYPIHIIDISGASHQLSERLSLHTVSALKSNPDGICGLNGAWPAQLPHPRGQARFMRSPSVDSQGTFPCGGGRYFVHPHRDGWKILGLRPANQSLGIEPSGRRIGIEVVQACRQFKGTQHAPFECLTISIYTRG